MRGISVALISDQHLSKLAVILLLLCCFLLLGDDLPTLLWTQASHPSAWCHNDIQGLMWWQNWQEFYWIGGNGWVKHIKAWGLKNFHVWSTDTLWQCGGKNSQRGGKTIIGRHFMNFGHNCPHRNSRVAVQSVSRGLRIARLKQSLALPATFLLLLVSESPRLNCRSGKERRAERRCARKICTPTTHYSSHLYFQGVYNVHPETN